jgi:D-cysteine desulfhydrase
LTGRRSSSQSSEPPPLLHVRFPALKDTLRHIRLGQPPTPVRRLAGLDRNTGSAPVWLKDDGVYGTIRGGNKVRKLEWILPDVLARGRRTILTFGGLGTNHGLTTALYAREHGLRTVLALVDQPLDDHVRSQLDAIARSGARVYRTHGTYRTVAALPWLLARNFDRAARRPPYFLPPGGSSPIGCVGYVEAAFELAEQVRAGELPEPSHAVVALGSGGTAAGLLLGLKLAGLRTRLVAVLVSDKMRLTPRVVARLARRTARILRARGAELPELSLIEADIDVQARWLGAGYGHRTAEGGTAIERLRAEKIELEPVYTAKAVAGLLALRAEGAFGEGPVLYWHTHDALTRGPVNHTIPDDRPG